MEKYTMRRNKEMFPTITIVTITKGRPKLLRRAISSVKEQTYPNIRHYIVIDDCEETLRMLQDNYVDDPGIYWQRFWRSRIDKDGPNILAKLRTNAIHSIDTEWFSFLDDDNEFYPEHIEKLYRFAQTKKCKAVHSFREVYNNDGSPYLGIEWPWGRTEEARAQEYKDMLKAGVAQKGSNIFRDRYGVTVDTNVWLLKTELFDGISIPQEYTRKDFEECHPEDEKMMNLLIEKRVMVLSNNETTVKYYLGGYSNNTQKATQGSVIWKP